MWRNSLIQRIPRACLLNCLNNAWCRRREHGGGERGAWGECIITKKEGLPRRAACPDLIIFMLLLNHGDHEDAAWQIQILTMVLVVVNVLAHPKAHRSWQTSLHTGCYLHYAQLSIHPHYRFRSFSPHSALLLYASPRHPSMLRRPPFPVVFKPSPLSHPGCMGELSTSTSGLI